MLQAFIVAFVVSFMGSIPPGSINITIMQLSISRQRRSAVFCALGASATEFIYAGLTVRFQVFISAHEEVYHVLKIITMLVLLALGVANLFAKASSKSYMLNTQNKGRQGFMRGVMLSLLNPLTIPFWLTVTIYLQSNGWIQLIEGNIWFYALGIAFGTLLLLMLVDILGSKFQSISDNRLLVHVLPGLTFLGMGLYYAWQLFVI